ncbi:MAG: efflux RND transporter periplasmic adaptor subunit [Phycisphaerales bacterium]|nr:efflux RND transporter periplasmic adaptor subunit [Phycisphaerales bacterium]
MRVQFGLLAAAAVAASVCSFAHGQGGDGPPATPVRGGEVRAEAVVERRLVTGELRAVKRARLAAQEEGLVVALPVREGQAVQTGELLAELDSRRLRLQIAEAEADAVFAEATIEERRESLGQAEREWERVRSAFEAGGATARERRDAEWAHRIAQARLAQAEAQRLMVAARLDRLREQLADTRIVAPFDAVVVGRLTEIGQWVSAGDAVVEVVAAGRVEAWLSVPQRLLGAVSSGGSGVLVEVGSSGRTLSAAEQRVVPDVDPRSRTFVLVATLEPNGAALAPGMSVVGWVPTGVEGVQLTVPKDAVLRNDAGAFVYRVSGGSGVPSPAFPAPVEVLFPIGDRYVIGAGALAEGDVVVVEGNERLFPGTMVRVVESAPAAEASGAGSGAGGGGPR